jgi:hypothetical protein
VDGLRIREAAFSPDGHLAIRIDSEILILDEALTVQRRLPIDDADIIAGPAAWSPDGTRIALARLTSQRDVSLAVPIGLRTIRLADRFESPEVALQQDDEPQGWRGNDSFVVWGPPGLAEISIATGARTPLAATGGGIVQLQVATGLLPDLVVLEPGDIDRGPWPWWARTAAALTAALFGLVTVAVVLAYRSRRVRPDRTPSGGRPDAVPA